MQITDESRAHFAHHPIHLSQMPADDQSDARHIDFIGATDIS
ncbi:hypothetical protein [Planomonospora alba]